MDPNEFRESRQAINRLCENINVLIDEKDLEASKSRFEEVFAKLDVLKPLAEGKIQKRSVRNLGVKLKGLSTGISKLKPKKKPKVRKAGKNPTIAITWDEDRVAQLSKAFLGKLFANMGNDADATVCFGTTGKGIRPGYQIEFASKDKTAFSGSGHTPLKKPGAKSSKKISKPFSYQQIETILGGK